eukprot:3312145-Amphidinium_carterae.1
MLGQKMRMLHLETLGASRNLLPWNLLSSPKFVECGFQGHFCDTTEKLTAKTRECFEPAHYKLAWSSKA